MRTTSTSLGSSSTTSTLILRGSKACPDIVVLVSTTGARLLCLDLFSRWCGGQFIGWRAQSRILAEDHRGQLRWLLARQREGEGRTLTQLAMYPDVPTVRLDDGPADIQPQSRSLCAPRRRVVHPLEALEDALLLAQRYALAQIADVHDHLARRHLPRHTHPLAARRI